MITGNIVWLVAIGVFIYFMMRKGGGCCGGHGGHDGHGRHDHGEHNHDHGATRNLEGDTLRREGITPAATFRDPVCGMTVGEDSPVPIRDHDGRTYRFCSEKCHKLFDVDPNKYIR
ncbi:MAG: YHS domain-containing protein [Proteobacteria bacterium]|nr:YHS domain-containing protein [Pseudomonadota bacterium]MBU1687579.1 YHS domain-containing protein [Pseudomonadota bacterium]